MNTNVFQINDNNYYQSKEEKELTQVRPQYFTIYYAKQA